MHPQPSPEQPSLDSDQPADAHGQPRLEPTPRRTAGRRLAVISLAALRRSRAYLGIAAVLIILGAGNLLFSDYRQQEYSELLSKATSEHASLKIASGVPFLPERWNLDRKSQQVSRLKSRIDFYSFVSLGGKALLALSGVFLLLSAAQIRSPGK